MKEYYIWFDSCFYVLFIVVTVTKESWSEFILELAQVHLLV